MSKETYSLAVACCGVLLNRVQYHGTSEIVNKYFNRTCVTGERPGIDRTIGQWTSSLIRSTIWIIIRIGNLKYLAMSIEYKKRTLYKTPSRVGLPSR